MTEISKVLSANDTGETGAHQAGILVPKEPRLLSFFPPLDSSSKNPRILLPFRDQSDELWQFAFIHYNNRYFGGTRNEFRLTRMTKYIRVNQLTEGDRIILSKNEGGGRRIRFERAKSTVVGADGILKLGGGWLVISF